MTATDRLSAATSIGEDGQTVTITRQASGTYDPATATAAITETEQTAKAVIFPFGPGLRNQAGSTITADDQQCLLSALTTAGAVLTAPKVNDVLTDANGDKWTITEVSPLAPAGLTIMYDLKIEGVG